MTTTMRREPGTGPSTALARSAIYSLLSNGLAYPVEGRLPILQDRMAPVLRDLDVDDPEVAHALAACLDALAGDLGTLGRAHQLQFTIIEPRDCPTYETAYRGRDVFRQANVMADVAGCYAAHGLQVGTGERERPDHITVELEFMAFLTAQQAYALERLTGVEAGASEHTQRLFLREHLGTWGPGFGRRVQATARHDLYRHLGALLAVWLEADMRFLGVEPSEVADEPMPPPPPEDGTCGVPVDERADLAAGVGSTVTWPIRLGESPP